VSLELSGAVGFPTEVPNGAHHKSLGRVATVIFGPAGPFELGLSLGFNEFDNKNDAGSVAFTTLSFDLRVPFVRAKRFGFFGVIAPELAFRTFSFSKEAQASNSLIPRSQTDGNLGLALGTGISFGLAGEWLSLVSTQKVHFVSSEVDGNVLFVVSFGIALSN
jgi:hypothetical protein